MGLWSSHRPGIRDVLWCDHGYFLFPQNGHLSLEVSHLLLSVSQGPGRIEMVHSSKDHSRRCLFRNKLERCEQDVKKIQDWEGVWS